MIKTYEGFFDFFKRKNTEISYQDEVKKIESCGGCS
jgi:hypothetical protein